LRVTNVDALIPTVLDGLGIAELPEFIATKYLADGRMVAILTDWTLPKGALYFVTPSAEARAAKVEAPGGLHDETSVEVSVARNAPILTISR
jgi:DNA-binding transcriptional LysR family regulator